MDTDGSLTTHSHAYCINSVVRGHHVYKDIWTPEIGEELTCRREVGNIHDLHAVAILRGGDVVGHVPRMISTPCNVFIRKGGVITCIISGHRQYSVDLEQGGLDVPCKLQFQGSQTTIDKLSKMLLNAPVAAADSKPMTALINQPQNSELYYVYKPGIMVVSTYS